MKCISKNKKYIYIKGKLLFIALYNYYIKNSIKCITYIIIIIFIAIYSIYQYNKQKPKKLSISSYLSHGYTDNACTFNPILSQLIAHQHIQTQQLNGSLNCEVENLIHHIVNDNIKLKVIGVLIHQCSPSPLRNIGVYHKSHDLHVNNLKLRRTLIESLLNHHNIEYRYYAFYQSYCDHHDDFIKFTNIHPNHIIGKYVKNQTLSLPVGSYYFIFYDRYVYSFIEEGGTQFDITKSMAMMRHLFYHKYTLEHFLTSTYATFLYMQHIRV